MRRLQGTPFATVDLIHGAAGTILGLLSLHQVMSDSAFLAAARDAGDKLVHAAIRTR